MELNNYLKNKNNVIKIIVIIIFIYQLLQYFQITIQKLIIFILSIVLCYVYYLKNSSNDKMNYIFIQKYGLELDFNNTLHLDLISYLIKIKNVSNKKLYLDLIRCIKSFLYYIKIKNYENSIIVIKEILNIHQGLFLNADDNKLFYNLLLEFINKKFVTEDDYDENSIHNRIKFNEIDNIIKDSNYNKNFDFY